MGKILHHGNWKKEKGLTLLETIIALAIIVTVSVSAVSVSVYTSNTFNDLSIKRFFQREVDNISEIYLSYDESTFRDAFLKLTGKTISGYNDTTYYLNVGFEYVEPTEEYAYKIALDFSGTNALTVTSQRSNNKEIRSRSVFK